MDDAASYVGLVPGLILLILLAVLVATGKIRMRKQWLTLRSDAADDDKARLRWLLFMVVVCAALVVVAFLTLMTF